MINRADFVSKRTDLARGSAARLAAPRASAASISASDSLAMNFSPARQQYGLVRGDDIDGAAHIVAFHAFGPDQLRSTIRPDQIDLGVAVAEHVNVRRLMVVDENHDSQASFTQDGDHARI
jgi:hypothetical protein